MCKRVKSKRDKYGMKSTRPTFTTIFYRQNIVQTLLSTRDQIILQSRSKLGRFSSAVFKQQDVTHELIFQLLVQFVAATYRIQLYFVTYKVPANLHHFQILGVTFIQIGVICQYASNLVLQFLHIRSGV